MMNQIIKEDLLHYVWKTKQIDILNLKTTEGQSVYIENWGTHNNDSGPDFFNGRVKIGETTWVGNIEMHVFSSDWEKHSHDSDPAYDNVILHVVYEEDTPILNHENKRIPCIQIANNISNKIKSNYGRLIHNEIDIPCQKLIHNVDELTIAMWKDRLVAERLEEKTNRTKTILESNNGDWESTMYILLCRYMGSKVNTQPFELLATNLPLHILQKNRDNLQNIEALLFGTAGMLEGSFDDIYFNRLKKEYAYLNQKYNISTVPPVMWKFSKMRPPNFPTVRLAQFAKIISKKPHLFSHILELSDVKQLRELFHVTASEYWDKHYRFGTVSKEDRPKLLTEGFIDLLLINVVAPILFAYGSSKGSIEYQERAITLLENIRPEKNSIISKWAEIGIKSSSAMDTQALIHLKNSYCHEKRCLSCNIGSKIVLR